MSKYEIQRDWFAWHPVKLDDGRWTWLRRVDRWLKHPLSAWEYWIADPNPKRATKFVDLWDALFGKRETFIRVEHDGSWFICEPREAWEFKGTAYDGDVYVTTEVRMTRRQFNNLPEFEGF